MKVLDLTETYLQKTCSNSLPFTIERVSILNYFTKNVNTLIIGDIRKLSHIFLCFFFKKIILVDDGMITVSIIKSDENLLFINSFLKREIIKFVLRFNNKKIDCYTIFLKKELFNKEIKINFKPNTISSDYMISKHVNSVLIVGMDLVELDIIEIDYYHRLISSIIKKNGKVYYYPHRNETIKHRISGLIYLERKSNIEKYILNEVRYNNIISFYSTTLVILDQFKLKDVKLNFIRLEDNEIKKFHKIIHNSYKYIESIGIEEY